MTDGIHVHAKDITGERLAPRPLALAAPGAAGSDAVVSALPSSPSQWTPGALAPPVTPNLAPNLDEPNDTHGIRRAVRVQAGRGCILTGKLLSLIHI